MAYIQMNNITKAYTPLSGDVIPVFSGLNLEIEDMESIAILGETGTGKSTLLRLLADLDKPDSGDIQIDHQDPKQIRLTNGFGMVFQTPVLYDWRTVRRNICMPMEIVDMPKLQRTARIDELLVTIGMEDYGKKYPFELSADLQQRVGIARALALNPQLLYMDDPFSGYESELRIQMTTWLKSLVQSLKKQLVMTTTDIHEAAFLGNKVLMLPSNQQDECYLVTFDRDKECLRWKDETHRERVEHIQRKIKMPR